MDDLTRQQLEVDRMMATIAVERVLPEKFHDYVRKKFEQLYTAGYDANVVIDKPNGCARAVVQLEPDYSLKAEFASIKQAIQDTKTPKSTILAALADNHLTKDGYYWFYKEAWLKHPLTIVHKLKNSA